MKIEFLLKMASVLIIGMAMGMILADFKFEKHFRKKGYYILSSGTRLRGKVERRLETDGWQDENVVMPNVTTQDKEHDGGLL